MCMVSIVVPVFNAVDSIELSLRSILCQSFSNWELVVVDDGSTDGTDLVLDRLAAEDLRIRVIHKKNTGSGDSRNIGMSMAQGKYLCFLDSDDELEPDALEYLINRAEREQCQILFYNNVDIFYDDQGHVDHMKKHDGCSFAVTDNNGFKQHFLELADSYYLFTAWNKLYLREFVEKIGARFDVNIKVGEDTVFTMFLYKDVARVSSTDCSFYRYAIRNNSLLHSFNPDRYRDAKYVYKAANRIISPWYSLGISVYARDFISQVQLYLFDVIGIRISFIKKMRLLHYVLCDPLFKSAMKKAGRMSYRGERVFVNFAGTHSTILVFMYMILVKYVRSFKKLKTSHV